MAQRISEGWSVAGDVIRDVGVSGSTGHVGLSETMVRTMTFILSKMGTIVGVLRRGLTECFYKSCQL